MTPLPPLARKLLSDANFPTLTTLRRGGTPRSWIVWTMLEGDNILICTRGGWKAADMTNNPAVAVAVFPADDPYLNVAIEGRVIEARPDDDCHWIDQVSVKYTGHPFPQRGLNTGGPGPHCFVIEPIKTSVRADLAGVKYRELIEQSR